MYKRQDKRTPFNIILYSEESLQNNVILPSKLLRYLCPIPVSYTHLRECDAAVFVIILKVHRAAVRELLVCHPEQAVVSVPCLLYTSRCV